MTEERRDFSLSSVGLEIRADGDSTPGFVGLATPYDSRTAIGNPLIFGFYEEMAKGAFDESLNERDQRMLIDHDTHYVVSRVSAGSLALKSDNEGVRVDSDLDTELSYVADLKRNLENGNIDGMSIGFRVQDDEWFFEEVETNDGHTAEVEVRRVKKADLIEVSAVTFPAYTDTEAGVRQAFENRDLLHPERNEHNESTEPEFQGARYVREMKMRQWGALKPSLVRSQNG